MCIIRPIQYPAGQTTAAPDQPPTRSGKLPLALIAPRRDDAGMGLIFAFVCGVLNFAMHKAVVESRHPLLLQMPWFFGTLGGKMGMVIEFVLLVGSMLMIAAGSSGWLIGYAIYSLVNGLAAWLILSHRI
jgi:hypothetical protein